MAEQLAYWGRGFDLHHYCLARTRRAVDAVADHVVLERECGIGLHRSDARCVRNSDSPRLQSQVLPVRSLLRLRGQANTTPNAEFPHKIALFERNSTGRVAP